MTRHGRDETRLPGPRYIVTELEGWSEQPGRGKSNLMGLSVHVLDTAWNHRLLRTWRTEDYHIGGKWTKERVRETIPAKAHAYADALNRGKAPPEPRHRGFRPRCPKCGTRCAVGATHCTCGQDLYRHVWNGHGAREIVERAQRRASL